jgi:hypothetical protein
VQEGHSFDGYRGYCYGGWSGEWREHFAEVQADVRAHNGAEVTECSGWDFP